MTLRDFVLVEFARAWQEEQGAARVDPVVVGIVRDDPSLAEADGPARLLLYARALIHLRLDDGEGQLAAESIRGTLSAGSVLVPLLGVVAGTAMLGAALPPPDVRPVSVFQFVAEGVLLPGLFLLWTLVLTQLLAGSVGRLHWVAWLLGLVRGRALRTRLGQLAGRVLRRSEVSAPLFATWSHLFWITGLGTFLVLGFWRFAFTDYLFSWSSTLQLTGEQVHRVFGTLALPVDWIPGVDAPSMEQVRLSEFGSLGLAGETGGAYVQSSAEPLSDQALRKGWFSVLLAIVAAWGLLPRLVGVVASRAMVRRRIRRSLQDPTSRMILAALEPPAAARGGEPTRNEADAPALPRPGSALERAGRGLDVLAFAAEPPSVELLDQLRLARLGLSGTVARIASDDDEDAMDAAVDRLAGAEGPEGVVVTFPVGSIPDALKEEFLARVVAALGAEAPVHVLLTGGEAFAASPRGTRFSQRVEAWQRVAVRAGIDAARVHTDLETRP